MPFTNITEDFVNEWNAKLQSKTPQEIIDWAVQIVPVGLFQTVSVNITKDCIWAYRASESGYFSEKLRYPSDFHRYIISFQRDLRVDR